MTPPPSAPRAPPRKSSILLCLALCCAGVLALAAIPSSHAFELRTPASSSSYRSSSRPLMRIATAPARANARGVARYVVLHSAAASDNDDTPDGATDEGASEVENEEGGSSSPTAEKEESVEEENPELVALKQQIADLESAVRAKRRQALSARDTADEFSKDGYARKVAEMENMRRARSMLNTSNRSAATASILAEFLPSLDQLNSLNEQYGSHPFGKQYGALPGALQSAFTSLGASTYDATVGDAATDRYRVKTVEEIHSTDVAKGRVVEVLQSGWELQGTVLRPVECVVSLGPQVDESSEASAASSDEEGSSA